MKQLTEQEFKVLRDAEDIMFNHLEYGSRNIYDNAFCELHKANNKYMELKEYGVGLSAICRLVRKE